jgi:hypothetical protein
VNNIAQTIEAQYPDLYREFGSDLVNAKIVQDRARAAYLFNHPAARRPEPFPYPQADPPRVEIQHQAGPLYPEKSKIWPELGLAAIRTKRSGAFRILMLARAIDPQGSGVVGKKTLRAYLAFLGVDPRQRRRWQAQALELGILEERKKVYILAGLARAAIILGCETIGKPALVNAAELVRKGWRGRCVWSAWHTSLKPRPLSQQKKYEMTGIEPRTQRNYLRSAGRLKIRKNISRTNHKPGDLVGLHEFTPYNFFATTPTRRQPPRIFQRLPDQVVIPGYIAEQVKPGRSKKAQKQVNATLYLEERGSGTCLRLFCENAKQTKTAHNKLRKSDLSPWEAPSETFELVYAGRRVNYWAPIPIAGM